MPKKEVKQPRIAIVGAGPIGVETAAFALAKGYEVDLYEQKIPGAALRHWKHVRFFSPWSLNRSPWGCRALEDSGVALAEDDAFPTGREYLDQYLSPLLEASGVAQSLHKHTRVVGISRRDALKGDFIGDPDRASSPFLLLLERDNGRSFAQAQIVIDTTGVLGQPNAMGPGGLPAPGEETLGDAIERHIPDALGADSKTYRNQTTLLLGDGYSAVTTAYLLAQLHQQSPETRILWLLNTDKPPYIELADDPLPQRLKLAEFGNEAIRAKVAGIEPIYGHLHRLTSESKVSAEIATADGLKTIGVDRVVSNVGYRPDRELYRELQIHQCYASEGPMNLAAQLLGSDTGGDCLAQSPAGFEALTSPEPDFYILGAKSYGRGSAFLLKLGFAQIQELFEGIDGNQ